MNHVPYECAGCDRGCQFCDGGLFFCQICKGGEGALTTDCPGASLTTRQLDEVYAGLLDYRGERWVRELSPHAPLVAR